MKKRFIAFALALLVLFCAVPVYADSDNTVRILFTHDIHSHLEMASRLGGAIRKEKQSWGSENMLILDAGDFSQGTMYQFAYEDRALELGLLSKLDYDVITLGNHEWDHGGYGLANMLNTAAASYDNLPQLVCANIDFSGELTDEQNAVKTAFEGYCKQSSQESFDYTIITMENGIRIGVFGVSGNDSIECSPTSGMNWTDYIDAAKSLVSRLKKKCDIIICLSHSGTSSESDGEDIALAKAVPDIDLIISGHSHSLYTDPVRVGTTIIVCAGEYMENLGCIDLRVTSLGNVVCDNFVIKPLAFEEINHVIEKYISECDRIISEEYLSQYSYSEPGQVIAHSSFDFIGLDEMYASQQEYNIGDIIADSYIYEARKNGINDIDVAIVGLGTIRDSIKKGDITLEDAFNICSLGVGDDGSSGHPLVAAYLTGKELKLLAELDVSLGSYESSIKMSYSGLRLKYNSCRMLLDKCTDVRLYDEFGVLGEREIEDDKLYKVCCNMYAANMLGMLNGLTKGVLSITPKNADGSIVEDFYDVQLIGQSGRAVKEWVAFADYLSFLGEIPGDYENPQSRKYDINHPDLESVLENPGLATWIQLAVLLIALAVAVLIIRLIVIAVVMISLRIKARKLLRNRK